ncbi:MAG: LamG domain-containing protein, partial [Bacteroidota bacterium]
MSKLLLLFLALTTYSFSQIPNYVPTNGLVGWWPFNGNANDESGNGKHGTVNGPVLTTDRFGEPGKAYLFQTFPNSIDLPELSTQLGAPNSSMTISLWFNTGNLNGNTGILFHSTNQSPQYILGRVAVNNANGDAVKIYHRNPTTNNEPAAAISPTLNIWKHLTVVIDGTAGVYKLYIDNSLVPAMTFNYNASENYFGAGRTWNIGSIPIADFLHQFVGKIDDVGVWNRALTQQEINNLYASSVPQTCSISASASTVCSGSPVTLTASSATSNVSACAGNALPSSLQNGLVGYWPFCGNANDASGNGNNGTVNGATLTTDRFGNANSAYSFDGVNDHILLNPNQSFLASGTSFSISFYYKKIGLPQPGDVFMTTYGNSPIANHFQIRPTGNWVLRDANSNELNGNNIGFSLPNDGLWHNYLFQRDITTQTIKIFIDGTLIGSCPNTTGNCANGNQIALMMEAYLNEYYQGLLDDIAIWNRALTAAEIQQIQNQGQTSFLWSTGAATSTVIVSPTQTTTYSCDVTVNGQTCTASQVVDVIQASVSASNDEICLGDDVQ